MIVITKCVSIIVLNAIAFYTSCVIHELGHFIVGKVLYFKLNYIEVFGIRFYWRPTIRIEWRNFRVNAKTSMEPKGKKCLVIRLIIYFSGGSIISLILWGVLYFKKYDNIYIYYLKINLILSIVLSVLPTKGTDIYNIRNLININARIKIRMKYYLKSGITLIEMPDKWFEFIENEKNQLNDKYLLKMWYLYLLESKASYHKIKEAYAILEKYLVRSNLLEDKIEILFYHLVFENQTIEEGQAKDFIRVVHDSDIYCKKRILSIIDNNLVWISDQNNKELLPGIKKVEEDLISIYCNRGINYE